MLPASALICRLAFGINAPTATWLNSLVNGNRSRPRQQSCSRVTQRVDTADCDLGSGQPLHVSERSRGRSPAGDCESVHVWEYDVRFPPPGLWSVCPVRYRRFGSVRKPVRSLRQLRQDSAAPRRTLSRVSIWMTSSSDLPNAAKSRPVTRCRRSTDPMIPTPVHCRWLAAADQSAAADSAHDTWCLPVGDSRRQRIRQQQPCAGRRTGIAVLWRRSDRVPVNGVAFGIPGVVGARSVDHCRPTRARSRNSICRPLTSF